MPVLQHLLFIRHGETVGNLEQIAHGQSESPLNDRGIKQARMTAHMLASWQRTYHRVYTSPLSRALHTGQHIAETLSLPIDVHDDLMEGSLGDWEGVTYQQLEDFQFARRSIRNDDFDEHNGETPNQLGHRVSRAVHDIRGRHPDENIIFVSHGAAISHMLARLLDTRPAFGHQYLMHNSAVTEICVTGDRVELLTLNYHEHLPDDLKVDPTRRDQHVAE